MYASAESVASAAGCSDIKNTAPGEVGLFATDEVQCRYGDRFTLVDWFKDADSRKNWTSASKGGGSYLLVGSNWAITCPDKTSCDAMQTKVGGAIQ